MRNWSRVVPFSLSTPERPVTGVDERARLTDQVTEHDREAQLSFHHQHRLHQPSELDGIVDLIEWSHRP